jgi:hypothetical protein
MFLMREFGIHTNMATTACLNMANMHQAEDENVYTFFEAPITPTFSK